MIAYQFEILQKSREAVLRLTEGLTEAQLNKIPKGFNNNIAWNVIHLVVTQQLLCYKLAGKEMYVLDEVVNSYRKGTAPDPSKPVSLKEFEAFKVELMKNVERIKNDYKPGQSFNSYTTSAGVTISSIEDAIAYNNYHEGLHNGSILSLLRAI
ncbi:DinB family protein [Galbibacter mesophilus]|uniref:DinB family protein n=1 Tax=Galbibacter mesophilus TaxID=379069 RepID=UPI00191F96A4|nr:DinB family protein [Galbibacter mesophilus]MCM5662446.1 DinB family protein [Galbibacter mesophilus]